MYRCAASLWHAAISGDVASARAPDGVITVDSTARAIKRSSTAAFPTRGRGGMLARSIEIGHPYFRSKRRAGKSANGSAQSVGRISPTGPARSGRPDGRLRRNPPTPVPEQPSGGLRFANPPYALGQTLPRHFTRRAPASTQKAATAGVRHRGRCGPTANFRPLWRN